MAQLPTPGALCGPDNDGVWTTYGVDQLAAPGRGSATDGGCITQGGAAHAFVRAKLGASYTLFEGYFLDATSVRRPRQKEGVEPPLRRRDLLALCHTA